MPNNYTFQSDLSCVVTNDEGTHELRLTSYNPLTRNPWVNKQEVRTFVDTYLPMSSWTDLSKLPTPEEEEERRSSILRKTRNTLLADTDWTQMPDSPLTTEAKTAWATYRTALRDITTHANWPNLADADWPVKP